MCVDMICQVQPEWIAMFNEEELQTLISGRLEEGLDIQDLRAHTAYAGGWQNLRAHTAYAVGERNTGEEARACTSVLMKSVPIKTWCVHQALGGIENLVCIDYGQNMLLFILVSNKQRVGLTRWLYFCNNAVCYFPSLCKDQGMHAGAAIFSGGHSNLLVMVLLGLALLLS